MFKKMLVVVALVGAMSVSANSKTCVLYNTKAERDANKRTPADMCENKTYPECKKWAEQTGKWGK